MDLAAFFSPEELAAWSAQRVTSQLLYFTALGIKLTFLITGSYYEMIICIGFQSINSYRMCINIIHIKSRKQSIAVCFTIFNLCICSL